jgi:LacI family transcriptional regulator
VPAPQERRRAHPLGGGITPTARRRATSFDVARLAGVSRTTVSFVLNDRPDARIPDVTRRRVLEAAGRLGYAPHGPARQLAGGTSQTLGLVLCQSPEQAATDALLPETLRGLGAVAESAGFRVLLESRSPSGDGYVELLRSGQVDGLIVAGPRSDDLRLRDPSLPDLPVVVQGSLPGSDVPTVDVDNFAGARRIVLHLVELGHRRIACVTNGPLSYTAAQERLDGYRRALEEAGIRADPRLVVEADFDPRSGARAAADLLDRAIEFSAVFVGSDMVATGVVRALRSAGRRVPQDLAVAGFDDIPVAAYFDPPLTTIHLPARDLGAVSGRVLLERVAGRAVPARTLLPTELVIRDSAGVPYPGTVCGGGGLKR